MLYPAQHQEQLCRTQCSSHNLKIRKNLCIHCEYYVVKRLKAIRSGSKPFLTGTWYTRKQGTGTVTTCCRFY